MSNKHAKSVEDRVTTPYQSKPMNYPVIKPKRKHIKSKKLEVYDEAALSPWYSFSNHWSYLTQRCLCLTSWGTCVGGVNDQYDTIMDLESNREGYVSNSTNDTIIPSQNGNENNEFHQKYAMIEALNDLKNNKNNNNAMNGNENNTNNTNNNNNHYYNYNNYNQTIVNSAATAPKETLTRGTQTDNNDDTVISNNNNNNANQSNQSNNNNNNGDNGNYNTADNGSDNNESNNAYSEKTKKPDTPILKGLSGTSQRNKSMPFIDEQEDDDKSLEIETLALPNNAPIMATSQSTPGHPHNHGKSFGRKKDMFEKANVDYKRRKSEQIHTSDEDREFKHEKNDSLRQMTHYTYGPAAHGVTGNEKSMLKSQKSRIMREKEDKSAIVTNDPFAAMSVRRKSQMFDNVHDDDADFHN